MRPSDKVVAWKASLATERISDCVLFLHVHGFLSDRERDKAIARARKWVAKCEAATPKTREAARPVAQEET